MIPFIRDFAFDYGQAEDIAPGIRRVIAKNPGPFTFTGTGTYLVGDTSGVCVIDPGPDDPAHLAALLSAAQGPITAIAITHTHRDHCGLTAALKEVTGATVHGFGPHGSAPHDAPPALDEGADFELRPDRMVRHGDLVRFGFGALEAVHTPGHTDNHLCFALAGSDVLFTGDHIMGWSTTVIAPPDGDMDAYLSSLDYLLTRADGVYLPTHGAPIVAPRPFVEAIRAHRMQRDEAILAALSPLPATAIDIARHVYTDVSSTLLLAASLNVTAHLQRHVKRGTVAVDANGSYRRTG